MVIYVCSLDNTYDSGPRLSPLALLHGPEMSQERYVAEGVSKDRFIRSVAADSGQPESAIVPERVKDGDSLDFEMAYHNFRKIVKFDGESGAILKVLT